MDLSIAIAALCAGSLTSDAASEATYTRTNGPSCLSAVIDGANETRCAGVAGYVAIIVERERVMKIDFRLATARWIPRRDSWELLWRGSGALIGDRIEWRSVRGRPYAAIVRIFTLTESDLPLQQLLVATLGAKGSCEIARINAGVDALGTARDLASSQSDIIECPLQGRGGSPIHRGDDHAG